MLENNNNNINQMVLSLSVCLYYVCTSVCTSSVTAVEKADKRKSTKLKHVCPFQNCFFLFFFFFFSMAFRGRNIDSCFAGLGFKLPKLCSVRMCHFVSYSQPPGVDSLAAGSSGGGGGGDHQQHGVSTAVATV